MSWRESSWALRPGLQTIALSNAQQEEQGLPADALALRVLRVQPKAAYVKQAGLRQGDVIVAVDSRTAPMTESQFMAYVRLNHPPGDSVRLTVLRGQQKEELTMRLE